METKTNWNIMLLLNRTRTQQSHAESASYR